MNDMYKITWPNPDCEQAQGNIKIHVQLNQIHLRMYIKSIKNKQTHKNTYICQ